MEWDRPSKDQYGNSLEPSGVENDYTYNGKEFQEELGINWHYYGFRVYDPAIARFTSVDPIAEDFAFVSGFNYAENNPIANIDLHGLQALFAADGTLDRYKVQKGQGPTQIAKDLNENYGCELTCTIEYTDIVQDNSDAFPNGFKEDGSVKDKTDDSFKSGNIEPEQILKITDGKEGGEFGKEKKELQGSIAVKDKFNKELDSMKNAWKKFQTNEKSSSEGGDPDAGMTMFRVIKGTKMEWRESKKEKQIDSINKVIKKQKDKIGGG